MTKRPKVWVKVLTKEDKAAVAATCERFIAEVLIPRFLPQIRPTEFNYPIAITGKWRGDKYSFIQRYRTAPASPTTRARNSMPPSPVSTMPAATASI